MSDGSARKVGIVGGGSAGFLAALALKRKLPALEITLIKSEQLPIIGVGEATTWAVPAFLHDYLGIDRVQFHREAHPTWKGGVRLAWGTRPYFDYTFEWQMMQRHPGLVHNAAYYCQDDMRTASLIRETMELGLSPYIPDVNGTPRLVGPIGYHIENETFVALLEKLALLDGVTVVDKLITSVRRAEDGGVAALQFEDGSASSFDLYVDCSGFRSRLLGAALEVPFRSFRSSLFCDRAVVGGLPRGALPVLPYTSAKTMRAGWTFVTEHWDRVNSGYVFSSAHISDDEAEREFRAFTGNASGPVRFVPYVSGRYERAWEHNVVAIGNSCGFVEPLQSTGLHMICDQSRLLVEVLAESDLAPTPAYRQHYNLLVAEEWDQIRQFLALHYKLNGKLDTPFWRDARAETDLAGAEEAVAVYDECGPSSVFSASLRSARGFFGWDGYLTLLVGMRAPTRRPPQPGPDAVARWREVQQQAVNGAHLAVPMEKAFAQITGDGFRFAPAERWKLA